MVDIAASVYAAWEAHANVRLSTGVNASSAHKKCDRAIWYDLRWASRAKFEGRMLRLFERGKNEEHTVYRELAWAGYTVSYDNGDDEQLRANNLNSWIRGKIDGIVWGNDLPERMVLEVKTHNLKSFEKLAPLVKSGKREHWVQMQLYMHSLEIRYALYFAVCKDDDRIYTEIVEYDPAFCDALMDRIASIIASDVGPARTVEYGCRWCDHNDVCNGRATAPRTCRTCVHVTFDPSSDLEGGRPVECSIYQDIISLPSQAKGCEHHLTNPDLHRGKQIDGDLRTFMLYHLDDGAEEKEIAGC